MCDAAKLPSVGDADVAAVASLFADPARCAVLLALDDGRALRASVLADEAGISRSTASSHLTKLTHAGLLSVETHGRHRYYRLAGPTWANYWNILCDWHPRARSGRCAKVQAPLGCALPARATTTSRAGWGSN